MIIFFDLPKVYFLMGMVIILAFSENCHCRFFQTSAPKNEYATAMNGQQVIKPGRLEFPQWFVRAVDGKRKRLHFYLFFPLILSTIHATI